MTPVPPTPSKAVWWIIGVPVTLMAIPIGIFVHYSNLQARSDSKVRELCASDGGIKVFEPVSVSTEQFAALPTVDGFVVVPAEKPETPDSPAFSSTVTETVIGEGNPRISRLESLVKRRSDGKVIGQIVTYARIGGDVPIGIGHPSSFICPDYKKLYADQAQFYRLERSAK